MSQTVSLKLLQNWRNDDKVLDEYFQVCVQHYNDYIGKKSDDTIVTFYSLYKQATQGDCVQTPVINDNNNSLSEYAKLYAWYSLKGTSKEEAKRRYITKLSEFNNELLQLVPDDKPPIGFPHADDGKVICAKCNSVNGCQQTLLNDHKVNLLKQLIESDSLHEENTLISWIRTALHTQQCIYGKHQPITDIQAKPFNYYFNRYDNGGFLAYDSMHNILTLVYQLVYIHQKLAYDMQNSLQNQYTHAQIQIQTRKALLLTKIYNTYSPTTPFQLEIQYETDTKICNDRRIADKNVNHTHIVYINTPTHTDNNEYDYNKVIQLRLQCISYGISPSVGVVTDLNTRSEL